MIKMIIRSAMFATLAVLAMGSTTALADDDKEMTTGRELMSDQERMEHRHKMRSMDDDERKAYRKEHHEEMRERAKEQGRELPEDPHERGKRLGKGQEKGMGKGKGMGR